MRARTVTAAVILALCTAFQSTAFDGCSGGAGPSVPLPPSDEPTCIVDDDCPPTSCEDRRCLAGVCTTVAPLRDMDGDGVAPPPCGDDCDDANRGVRPGATELCDGLDQDCDGTVDEAATPAAVRRVLGLGEQRMRASAFGVGMVVLEVGFGDGLAARFVDFIGVVGVAVDLEVGEDPDFYDVARTDDGAVAVVFHASTGLIEGIPMTIGPGDDPIAGARFLIADVSASPNLADLRAESLPIRSGGATARVLAVAWRTALGDTWIWVDGFAAPVPHESGPTSTTTPDLATDGTSVVVTRGVLDAVFYDVATGVERSSQTLPGASWATDPLGSGDGRVVAVVRDAFDHALTSFTMTTAAALRPVPTSMPRSLPARLDTGPEFHVLTRFDDGGTTFTPGVWAWIIDPVTLEDVAMFSRDEVSGPVSGISVVDYDVVVSESGAAVLTSFGLSGAAITTFACRDGG